MFSIPSGVPGASGRVRCLVRPAAAGPCVDKAVLLQVAYRGGVRRSAKHQTACPGVRSASSGRTWLGRIHDPYLNTGEGTTVNDSTTGPTTTPLAAVDWHISTKSENGGGSCVEAGPLQDGTGRVAVRHSHHPDGHAIVFSAKEWAAFIGGVHAGEFDFGR